MSERRGSEVLPSPGRVFDRGTGRELNRKNALNKQYEQQPVSVAINAASRHRTPLLSACFAAQGSVAPPRGGKLEQFVSTVSFLSVPSV